MNPLKHNKAMKKVILFALCACFLQVALGQTFTPCSTCDTIPGRYYKYYYTQWYDTCADFDDTIHPTFYHKFSLDSPIQSWGPLFAKWNYTPQPMGVLGLTAMVDIYADHRYFRDTVKEPEYLFLYQLGANNSMIKLDSVRWDTIKPHIMKLPLSGVYERYAYCYAYDVYFKSPVTVDSSFYVAGTVNSNYFGPTETDPNPAFSNIPTFYRSVEEWTEGWGYDPNDPPVGDDCHALYQGKITTGSDTDGPWYPYVDVFGYYLPIVSQHRLDVEPSDSSMGATEGAGFFPDDWYDTIRAVPELGYRFLSWNDGNTDNPRVVRLRQDTLFTAVFAEGDVFSVQLAVNDPALGSVEGEGSYNAGMPVVIRAVPTDTSCEFVWWNDQVTDNPRTVILSQDTAFTAIFYRDTMGSGDSDTTGIAAVAAPQMKLSPNPVRDNLTLRMGAEDSYRVEVYNDLGYRLLVRRFTGARLRIDLSALPLGHYLLKVQSAAGIAVRAFIKR